MMLNYKLITYDSSRSEEFTFENECGTPYYLVLGSVYNDYYEVGVIVFGEEPVKALLKGDFVYIPNDCQLP